MFILIRTHENKKNKQATNRAAVFIKRSIPFCNRFVNVVSSVLGFQNPVMDYFVRNFMKNKPG